ncbi:MAG: AAA family ATPase [Desulfuromonas sp.]|nr:AAA family ATPase [Desulfuromonas sp.]
MGLPNKIVAARYSDPGIAKYRKNPLIEALPPIMSAKQIRHGLSGSISFNPKDLYVDANKRAHLIAQILDDFFQPLSSHIELETKLSIMIRQGYVGRNLMDGSLNTHMQNGYERLMSGDLEAFRFDHVVSTARSLSLIGCSGSGKSSTINRILATYPQAIFHEKYNFTQITYLKLDCPHDGSLKNLCFSFFRAIDSVLRTNYEKKYASKGHSRETLLATMSQIANLHAVGVLVIDEIQHLSVGRSGGVEVMLNFFVTLVNVIGLPVVMVGTPKARPIFETNLRSARRGAGLGALFWDPMKAPEPKLNATTGNFDKTEWIAFTDKLWKYQWLQKRDEILRDEVRECWYDLSQGVLDIVVKLFVLAQLRAIVTRTERLTVKLLQQVYNDELKPVHPMLAALRSGDPDLIAEFSDLGVEEMDKKVLRLHSQIHTSLSVSDREVNLYGGNEQAERLHNLLVGMDCSSDLIVPLIKRVFSEHPSLQIRELMSIVLEWYESKPQNEQKKAKVKPKDWHTLDSDDLRFIFSQCDSATSVYQRLRAEHKIFDIESWPNNMN